MGSARHEHELTVAHDAALRAGELLLEHFREGVRAEAKGERDLVSAADRQAEALIRAALAAAFGDDLIVGEEGEKVSAEAARGRRRWYVDPLDGTTNFLKGRRWWAVSIGFCDADDAMAAGVVHMPLLGETYLAARGQGATHDGVAIRCATTARLDAALVTSNAPAVGPDNRPALNRVIPRVLALRAPGALAPDLCAVAAGQSDALWARRVGPWDIAAAMLIATEAGAVVTDLDGTPATSPPASLLAAATPALHRELRALVAGD